MRGREVIRRVAAIAGVPVAELLGRSRRREVVRARQVAMWLIATGLGYTASLTGRLLQRDHSTVLHAIRCVRQALACPQDAHQRQLAALALKCHHRLEGMLVEDRAGWPEPVEAVIIARLNRAALPQHLAAQRAANRRRWQQATERLRARERQQARKAAEAARAARRASIPSSPSSPLRLPPIRRLKFLPPAPPAPESTPDAHPPADENPSISAGFITPTSTTHARLLAALRISREGARC